ncbi:MAG: hypothetical protein V3T83_22250 [Acidobacteriota bacterium]
MKLISVLDECSRNGLSLTVDARPAIEKEGSSRISALSPGQSPGW